MAAGTEILSANRVGPPPHSFRIARRPSGESRHGRGRKIVLVAAEGGSPPHRTGKGPRVRARGGQASRRRGGRDGQAHHTGDDCLADGSSLKSSPSYLLWRFPLHSAIGGFSPNPRPGSGAPYADSPMISLMVGRHRRVKSLRERVRARSLQRLGHDGNAPTSLTRGHTARFQAFLDPAVPPLRTARKQETSGILGPPDK